MVHSFIQRFQANTPLPLTPPPPFSHLSTTENQMTEKTDDDFKTWEEATKALGHTKVWKNTSANSVEFKLWNVDGC